jgi:hypothetical protein
MIVFFLIPLLSAWGDRAHSVRACLGARATPHEAHVSGAGRPGGAEPPCRTALYTRFVCVCTREISHPMSPPSFPAISCNANFGI